jgi:DNA-binding NarL/FixJ family response regulator
VSSELKTLVIDDHALIRQAMHGVLKKLRRDAVVLEAATSKQAMQILADETGISLILLDLTLPDGDGFSVLAELRELYPAISIVVLSGLQDPVYVMKALDLGALGYIPKSAEPDVMLSALRLVYSGGIYIPPQILGHEEFANGAVRQLGGNQPSSPLAHLGLTDRQLEVLTLLMQGKNNKIICRTLNLAEATVKNHVTGILKALNVTNRTEAVIAAGQFGFKVPAEAKH